MNLTNKEIKLIRSLEKKKYRKEHGLFVAEGTKVIQDLLDSGFVVEKLFLNQENYELLKPGSNIPVKIIEDNEFGKISFQKTPQKALALVETKSYELPAFTQGLYLVTDNIQDPGNLGTIIRLADWFGLDGVLCTIGTVDIYNPKTVQSAMGSLFRVKFWYMPSEELTGIFRKSKLISYGTFLDGQNIYTEELTEDGFIVIGNEAHGISKELSEVIDQRLTIPAFKAKTVESLNAAVATAIVCSEFRRRTIG